jgi:hypothetical protein
MAKDNSTIFQRLGELLGPMVLNKNKSKAETTQNIILVK